MTTFSNISIFCCFFLIPAISPSPLSTSSRWIVDQNSHRVKLACVNWASHLDTAVAEGLSNQPVDMISKRIATMGFNCVRLTWPLHLATNESLADITVRESFMNLGLIAPLAGLESNNPAFLDLALIEAFQEVVKSLERNNVLIILDNHLTKPGWCCNNNDGNGFFGDQYFNPEEWIKGLTLMARMFLNKSNVIGMSLRNELRGPRQNVNDWYKYMQLAAEAVHLENPDILIILSGLNFDLDLSFIKQQSVRLSFTNKLVYEVHWYGFSDGSVWANGNANQVCKRVVDSFMNRAGFLINQGYPLFLSEFGGDLRGGDVNDNRYLNCLMSVAADMDLDWALWTLAGSYYLRQGAVGMEEYFGILNSDWSGVRNSTFLQRISSIQDPFQGPGLPELQHHNIIYHPSTGFCVLRSTTGAPLKLGACAESEAWEYTAKKTLVIKEVNFCLTADQLEQPAKLDTSCSDHSTIWERISDSKLQLSTNLANENIACLDTNPTGAIIISNCKCLNMDKTCDPASQWFKIINSYQSLATHKFILTDSHVHDKTKYEN